ncbi:putative DNA modification/repair radical SAM protein [Sulfurospirillum arcachonense]|uniref:putative DNA modification/repair radical SAM protein n=1 Tax=Sulfurospirillum arcachonense TaxID=57666 RepID=UPI0004B38797|nr:putative DNA modification/repair radical SAM protein [Sulfurospirillum arcachonense]
MKISIFDKLSILSDSAKYDVSCSSSGVEEQKKYGGIGATENSGICHTFTSDGRCVSLLKVLLTNFCIYDCAYCINRASNDTKRVAFSPRELADLTINFYKRNYIEGLFLSSGIIHNEDHTMELLINTLKILRYEHGFDGYIHLKLIPGASKELIEVACALASRVSSNIELPSSKGLKLLAPQKTKNQLLEPLKQARDISLEKSAKPIPMSTQMIIGATSDSDFDILKTTSVLYNKALLKRVYYSAYVPVNEGKNLPVLKNKMPPIQREHRLYQADWLLRFYGFSYTELFTQEIQHLDTDIDPKTFWALNNLHLFPVDVNKVSKEILIRIPGIGIRGALKIIQARRFKTLSIDDLKQLKISIKRAKYFIISKGTYQKEVPMYKENIKQVLLAPKKIIQPTLFDENYSIFTGEL